MTDFFKQPLTQQLHIMEQAALAALPLWGLTGATLTLIKHRENAVYKAELENRAYAVRVHRLNYHSDTELHSELLWMDALTQSGVDTPNVIPATDGELFKRVASEDCDQPFQVDIQEWFTGTPLGEIGSAENLDQKDANDHYFKIGVIAAKTHNQACSWQEPEGFSRHAWDLDGLTGDNPFWGRFWEVEGITPEQRLLLEQCREKLRGELKAFGSGSDRYSLIHADFLPENILINHQGLRLIDFDDAGYGWHLFDLATSLVFLLDTPEFDGAMNAVIEGYRQERELSDEHLAMLPSFIVARWTTYLGWVHTRSETQAAQDLGPYILSTIDDIAGNYLNHS